MKFYPLREPCKNLYMGQDGMYYEMICHDKMREVPETTNIWAPPSFGDGEIDMNSPGMRELLRKVLLRRLEG